MQHPIMPLPFKPSRLKGLSERLVVNHYRANYGGALQRLGAIHGRLASADWERIAGFELNGLRREALLAENSVLLHEAYFDVLGGDGVATPETVAALSQDFGSFERWRAAFIATARALAGGSGWALLVRSGIDGRLAIAWGSDHGHMPAGAAPILALDMYEHAYQADFGPRAADYIEAFFANLDWRRIAQRIAGQPRAGEAEPMSAVEELRDALAAPGAPIVVDVRRREDRAAAPAMLPGAVWRDPEGIDTWAGELAGERPVVVYCVYGFEVGRGVAAALRRRGIPARALAGGIAAWQAAGGAVAQEEAAA